MDIQMTPAYEEIAKSNIRQQLVKEFETKRRARFPNGVVPDAVWELPTLDAKDRENTVFRLVAYKN
jgi:hypothetical protein